MNENQNMAPSPADDLIQKYEALTKEAQKILFPQVNILLESWPDTSPWPWWKKLAFYFDKPHLTSLTHTRRSYIPFIAVFLRLLSYYFGAILVLFFYREVFLSSPIGPVETNILSDVILWTIISCCFLMTAANTVIQLIHCEKKRKQWCLLVRIFLPIIIFATVISQQSVIISFHFLSILLLAMIFYPFYIMLVSNLPLTLLSISILLANWFVAIEAFHKPHQTSKIKRFLESSLTVEDQKPIHVLDLSLAELSKIKEWGSANQDTSEKRLNPLLIVLAFLALFAGSEWFEKQIHAIIQILIKGIQSDSLESLDFMMSVMILVVVIFILIFLHQILIVFSNISIQSLIVETCIVAEYEISEREKREKQLTQERAKKLTFFQKLRNCFCKKNYNQP